MKKFSITVINLYQVLLSPILHQLTGTKNACRFEETCSEFAKRSINEFGIFKGTKLSLIRLSKCQPFYKQI